MPAHWSVRAHKGGGRSHSSTPFSMGCFVRRLPRVHSRQLSGSGFPVAKRERMCSEAPGTGGARTACTWASIRSARHKYAKASCVKQEVQMPR